MLADERTRIPARLNGALLAVAAGASVALLAGASHSARWWVIAVCAIGFSYTANTLFALLHEAVHGVLHPNRNSNEWMGRAAAAFFPTSLAIQRAFHITHHRNNRSSFERFDYLQPGDIVWLKFAHWYSILTGFYWLVTTTGLFAYLVTPRVLRVKALRARESRVARQTSSGPYLDALDAVPPMRARIEIVASIAFQVALFAAIGGTVAGWVACYAAFALQWSSLQYADHAFSALDTRNGAWNLRVNRVTRALFLNYHLHLTHHREPTVPWIHLPGLTDPNDPQPRYRDVWLAMWRGPRPLPDGPTA